MQNIKKIPLPVKIRAIAAPILFFMFFAQYLSTGCVGQPEFGSCGGFSVWILGILFAYAAFWVGYYFYKLRQNK